nr:GNAT family N-acetyltransferase [Paenibacillus dakarensis]
MKLYLKPLEPIEPPDIYQMIQDIGEGQNGFINSLYSSDLEIFREKLIRNVEISQGKNLSDGLVPQTIYWFYLYNRPIGYGKLRHRLTDKLLEHGGHIGYIIRPAERNKGYGKHALGELVKEAYQKGINEILLTCNEDNMASRKVIEANHGFLTEMKEGVCKYWIKRNSSL